MGGTRTRRVAAVFVVLQAAAAAMALWLSRQFQVARMAATVVALVPTLPGTYLAWAAYRADRDEAAADIDAKAKTLATAVARAETLQRAQLIGPGAHCIPLAFTHRPEPANNAAGPAPNGHLTDIVAYYQNLRPGRLVITGEPGAGKTLLALQLILGLLAHPQTSSAGPVAIRLSLADWDPARPLPEWLAERIHDQFRDIGLSLADVRRLVQEYRVLPVLDGLDEMDTATTPPARRRAVRALQQVNAYQDPSGNAPVILTCRTAQYTELAMLDIRMREAARIELDPVTPAQAAAYLTARSTNPARWLSVLHTLTAAPEGTLAQALSTPWRLNLAVTAYEERHPATLAYLRAPDLLLTLASPSVVRDHLFALYLPAAISQHPTDPGRYRPDQTHNWLAALATYLTTTSASTDIVLHQLWPMAGSRRVRGTDALLATTVALLFAGLLLAQTSVNLGSLRQVMGATGFTAVAALIINRAMSAQVGPPVTIPIRRLRTPIGRQRLVRMLAVTLTGGLAGGVAIGIAARTAYAIAAGLAYALAAALATGLSWRTHVAKREEPVVAHPSSAVWGDLAVGLTTGLIAGCATGLTVGLTQGVAGGLAAGVTAGVSGALAFGTAAGLAYGLAAGLTTGLATGLVTDLGTGFTLGLAGGVVGGIYLFTGAGRRYLVFLCCSRGRLPWRLGGFLNWAYGAGLLRTSGTAYQFRHRELQDWLTAHPHPQH
ncbi:NACHT domain-containing protein [Streptomyces sp. NPDC051016]|uniref:NACHT domain-containing protein n=1 Tax=Streptomyces sp. NPDC051016 TaxID=3365638 RepID=UPI003795C85C